MSDSFVTFVRFLVRSKFLRTAAAPVERKSFAIGRHA